MLQWILKNCFWRNLIDFIIILWWKYLWLKLLILKCTKVTKQAKSYTRTFWEMNCHNSTKYAGVVILQKLHRKQQKRGNGCCKCWISIHTIRISFIYPQELFLSLPVRPVKSEKKSCIKNNEQDETSLRRAH